MVSLTGLAEIWEDSRLIRKAVRTRKSIFTLTEGEEDVQICTKSAGRNFDVLAPLVKHMVEDGEVRMHHLMSIRVEILCRAQLFGNCFLLNL